MKHARHLLLKASYLWLVSDSRSKVNHAASDSASRSTVARPTQRSCRWWKVWGIPEMQRSNCSVTAALPDDVSFNIACTARWSSSASFQYEKQDSVHDSAAPKLTYNCASNLCYTAIQGCWQKARSHGSIRGQFPPNFCVPANFVVPRTNCFKDLTKTKFCPPKNVFSPQNVKPGYGPGRQAAANVIKLKRFACTANAAMIRHAHKLSVFYIGWNKPEWLNETHSFATVTPHCGQASA